MRGRDVRPFRSVRSRDLRVTVLRLSHLIAASFACCACWLVASTAELRPAARAPDADGPGGGGRSYRDEVLADRPVAYWRLGEAQGSTANDETGAAHVGIYTGAVDLAVPGAIAGDPDRAARLGIDGGFVSMGNVFDFAGVVSFTLEAWVQPDVIDDGYRRVTAKL